MDRQPLLANLLEDNVEGRVGALKDRRERDVKVGQARGLEVLAALVSLGATLLGERRVLPAVVLRVIRGGRVSVGSTSSRGSMTPCGASRKGKPASPGEEVELPDRRCTASVRRASLHTHTGQHTLFHSDSPVKAKGQRRDQQRLGGNEHPSIPVKTLTVPVGQQPGRWS